VAQKAIEQQKIGVTCEEVGLAFAFFFFGSGWLTS
jgi:hypothetical protein